MARRQPSTFASEWPSIVYRGTMAPLPHLSNFYAFALRFMLRNRTSPLPPPGSVPFSRLTAAVAMAALPAVPPSQSAQQKTGHVRAVRSSLPELIDYDTVGNQFTDLLVVSEDLGGTITCLGQGIE